MYSKAGITRIANYNHLQMKQVTHSLGKLFLAAILLCMTTIVFGQTQQDTVIKKKILPIPATLSKLMQLEPKTFEYNTNKFHQLQQGLHYGFLAENMQAVFPELVRYKNFSYLTGKNNYRNVAVKEVEQQNLIPILVASIKEQQTQLNALKAEIELLKNKIMYNASKEEFPLSSELN